MAESQVALGFEGSEVNEWLETALSFTPKQALIGDANLYDLDVDNASAQQVHVKVYFKSVGDVVVGTTDPDMIFPVPNGVRLNFPIVVDAEGKFGTTAITLACVQEAGSAGTTAPSANVATRLTYKV